MRKKTLSFARGILTMSFCAVSLSLFAQSITVKGSIKDKDLEPIAGATVVVKGATGQGALSNLDGEYVLDNVPSDAILEFSFIGMKKKETAVNRQTRIDVILEEDVKALSELVVVGYSTQRKESLTGALQSVKNEKIKNITSSSTESLLNGKVSGVYVIPGSGPGSEGKVVIRGKTTINGSVDPLWVIDGVIVGASPGALNSDDIESFTVLKDAASTAIYGSQGANGVVLVTTKRPLAEQLRISTASKVGLSHLSKGNLEMMNGSELYDYYKSFSNSSGITFPRWNAGLRDSNFDWWNFASRTGLTHEHSVSINGGSDKLNSVFSLSFFDEKGAIKGGGYKRYTARYKTNYNLFENRLIIKPNFSLNLVDSDTKGMHSTTAMYANLPWDMPYDKNGEIIDDKSALWVNSNGSNYIKDIQWNYSTVKNYNISGGIDFDLRITKNLSFSSINNYRQMFYFYNQYTDPRSAAGSGVKGRIEEKVETSKTRYTNHLLRYNRSFDKHSINALLAYEYRDNQYKWIQAIGTGFYPEFTILNVTSLPEKTAGNITEWAVQSLLFNAHYAYDERYLTQLSLRRDGASNFGKNAPYGNFFSLSGAWNIHKEKFLQSDAINQLKLRASYGSVGNRPSELYPQRGIYSVSSKYNDEIGLLISQIENEDVTWEKTFTTGVGLDAEFWDRIRITLDLYQKKTSNLLYAAPISGVIGVTSIWRNVGEVQNRGLEFTLGADIIKKRELIWSFDANIGLNRNKVMSLYDDKKEIIREEAGIAGASRQILRPGLDVDSWYIQEWAGVNPDNGAPQWYKTVKNADGTSSREKTSVLAESDLVVLGSSSPLFFGGFSSYLKWKNFDANADFGYSVGGKIYNYIRQEYDSDGAYPDRNQMRLRPSWSRWEKEGDVATHPLAEYNNKSLSNKVSSRYLEDGSYLKLRSLTIGYNSSLKSLHISNFRVFLTGENLFCLTAYSGVDPEVPPAEVRGVLKVTATSRTAYPSVRRFMIGLNLSF